MGRVSTGWELFNGKGGQIACFPKEYLDPQELDNTACLKLGDL